MGSHSLHCGRTGAGPGVGDVLDSVIEPLWEDSACWSWSIQCEIKQKWFICLFTSPYRLENITFCVSSVPLPSGTELRPASFSTDTAEETQEGRTRADTALVSCCGMTLCCLHPANRDLSGSVLCKGRSTDTGWDVVKGQGSFWAVICIHLLQPGRYFYSLKKRVDEFDRSIDYKCHFYYNKMLITLYCKN